MPVYQAPSMIAASAPPQMGYVEQMGYPHTASTRTAVAVGTEAPDWTMDSDISSDSASVATIVANMVITVGSGIETLD